MTGSFDAARAYGASASHRSQRQQEADVFRYANALLRRARKGGALDQARALADNDRLWAMVLDLVRDPSNALPRPVCAAIASLGLAVRRELGASDPDIEFLVTVNENVARGLSGSP